MQEKKIGFNCFRTIQNFDIPMEKDTSRYPPFYFKSSKDFEIEFPLHASSNDSISDPYFNKLINYFKR